MRIDGTGARGQGGARAKDESMVTLADVARHAGVSTTTVSHVVNRTRFVSPETLERVDRAIRETGFSPNPYARALRTATTESIGFVASDIANPFSTAVMKGIETATRDANHMLLVANSNEDPVLESEAITALMQRRVDGLIVALTTTSDDSALEHLVSLQVPVVLIDRSANVDLDQVLVENVQSVETLVGRLIDMGHERIAVVAGLRGHSTSDERVAGWGLAYSNRRITPDMSLISYCGAMAADAERATHDLLSSDEAPSAIFAVNNTMTQGVLRALKARSLHVPVDISVVAFDDFEWADLLEAPLTCLAQPTFAIGFEAVQLLLRRLSDHEAPPSIVRLEPQLQSRSSWLVRQQVVSR